MLIYHLLLVLVLGLAYPLCIKSPSPLKKAVYVGTVFFIFYLFCIFRFRIGNDYYSYHTIFMGFAEAESFGEAAKLVTEPGFALLNYVLIKFTTSIKVMYAVYSLLILAPAGFAIWRYSKNAWLSCYLYICLTFFYQSMNFIRQAIAGSILLLAFCFIREKKHVLVVLFVLLAAAFHSTALVFIPIYFVSLIKPTKALYAAYGGLSLVCYFATDLLFALAAELMGKFIDPRYAEYIDSRYTEGLSWVFMIVPVIIGAIVIAVYWRTDWREKEPAATFYVNCMFFSVLIWLFVTGSMIIQRISDYTYIFAILAIPSIADYFLGNLDGKSSIIKDLSVPSYMRNSPKKAKKGIRLSATAKKAELSQKNEKKVRKDSYILALAGFMAVCFIYNIFGMNDGSRGFHGVFPYSSFIPEVQHFVMSTSFADKDEQLVKTRYADMYFTQLKSSRYSYIITIIPYEQMRVESETIRALSYLGLDYDFTTGVTDCYVAFAEKGRVLHEEKDDESVSFKTSAGGADIEVYTDIYDSFIYIDGRQCSLNNQGINIVVLDSGTGKVVDAKSVSILSSGAQQLTEFKEDYRENIPQR